MKLNMVLCVLSWAMKIQYRKAQYSNPHADLEKGCKIFFYINKIIYLCEVYGFYEKSDHFENYTRAISEEHCTNRVPLLFFFP